MLKELPQPERGGVEAIRAQMDRAEAQRLSQIFERSEFERRGELVFVRAHGQVLRPSYANVSVTSIGGCRYAAGGRIGLCEIEIQLGIPTAVCFTKEEDRLSFAVREVQIYQAIDTTFGPSSSDITAKMGLRSYPIVCSSPSTESAISDLEWRIGCQVGEQLRELCLQCALFQVADITFKGPLAPRCYFLEESNEFLIAEQGNCARMLTYIEGRADEGLIGRDQIEDENIRFGDNLWDGLAWLAKGTLESA